MIRTAVSERTAPLGVKAYAVRGGCSFMVSTLESAIRDPNGAP
jgi:hypothetical protein